MNKKSATWIWAGTLASSFWWICRIATGRPSVSAIVLTWLSGAVAAWVVRLNKLEKLFVQCGLENKAGQLPEIIKKTRTKNVTTYVLHMPAGISQKHFENKQEELEQFLNCKIEFAFNKELVMKCIDRNLSNYYPYEFIPCKKPLEVVCGIEYGGRFTLDIEKCPHILVAGETDSGKSSLLDVIALSLILSRHKVELHLIDFQAVTLGKYENCRKVKSYGETPEDCDQLLDELEEEAHRRLKLFRSVKNRVYIDKLSTWNSMFPARALPYKVVIIDEFARLADKRCEDILDKFRQRVAMDRKVGIHYIASMQRPDVNIIAGSIKANMPVRVAFKTFSEVDSRVILDQDGAESLTEQGRFLIKYCGNVHEVQALYVDPKHILKILKQNDAIKTKEEMEQERREKIAELRSKIINPYLKGVANNDY